MQDRKELELKFYVDCSFDQLLYNILSIGKFQCFFLNSTSNVLVQLSTYSNYEVDYEESSDHFVTFSNVWKPYYTKFQGR